VGFIVSERASAPPGQTPVPPLRTSAFCRVLSQRDNGSTLSNVPHCHTNSLLDPLRRGSRVITY
jgi:hypothetical protein